jgi:hypothetical protein
MRTGTTRAWTWLLGAALLGVAGCGATEQETLISEALGRLDDLTGKLKEIQKQVKEAVETSDKKGVPITAADENLVKATKTAEDLKKIGERLQRIKEYTDRANDKTPPAYKEELLEKNQGRIRDKVKELQTAEGELRTVLAQAEARADPNGKDQLKLLKDEIKNGHDAFELLTKHR